MVLPSHGARGRISFTPTHLNDWRREQPRFSPQIVSLTPSISLLSFLFTFHPEILHRCWGFIQGSETSRDLKVLESWGVQDIPRLKQKNNGPPSLLISYPQNSKVKEADERKKHRSLFLIDLLDDVKRSKVCVSRVPSRVQVVNVQRSVRKMQKWNRNLEMTAWGWRGIKK